LKPNIIFTQSLESDAFFKKIGYNTKIITNGVDLQKFKPVDQHLKLLYREKYDIPKNKFVILHNVAFKKIRNIEMLENLLHPDNHILLIGRIHENIDLSEIQKLQKKGFDVRIGHFNMEEIYWLSDCYVFPGKKKNAAVETPLSILEAMACNLPIITTPYGSVKDLFLENDGFYFANTISDFKSKINEIKMSSNSVNTRKQVLKLSWGTIASQIEESYLELFK
jgi:glycosyltransferase involved in cell wall biosynthesis